MEDPGQTPRTPHEDLGAIPLSFTPVPAPIAASSDNTKAASTPTIHDPAHPKKEREHWGPQDEPRFD